MQHKHRLQFVEYIIILQLNVALLYKCLQKPALLPSFFTQITAKLHKGTCYNYNIS